MSGKEQEAPAAATATAPSTSIHEQVLELKNRGNENLMAGHILDSVGSYTEALTLIASSPDYNNDDTSNAANNNNNKTNAIILSNRAQAYIKLENYGLAIVDASDAIAIDPTYPKGYYRRGTANFALNKPKSARKDFKMVCKLKPKDRDARVRYAECDKMVKAQAFASAIVSKETVPLSESYEPGDVIVASGYDGPHPNMEEFSSGEMDKEDALFEPGHLPLDFVMAAIQCFKDQKLIHKRYVARLLIHCKQYFEKLPSLMDISVPKKSAKQIQHSGNNNDGDNSIHTNGDEKNDGDNDSNDDEPHVTVCGDTHGQFYDVLNIFSINGYPSSSNPYLFNGDFVDRGSFSVEVILMFLLFKMSNPDCIYLTRGNHETKNMNRIYGFEGEVKAKYDDKIFDLFLEVFCQIPLAAVIENKVFVTHGGIPVEPASLDEIRKIQRGCEPPEKGLMSDLLWSDPQPFAGKSPSKRGVGFSFGPDITEAFLEKNGLNLLVRSHEVKDEGYLVEHGGKTITVFSAPNYCDSMGNKGAFIHFGKDGIPKFTQFKEVPHPAIQPMAYAAGMGGLFT